MLRASPAGYSRLPPTRYKNGSYGMAKPTSPVRDLAMRGAYRDSCRMIRLGWGVRPIVNQLRLDYPRDHLDTITAVVQLASERCVAATLLSALAPGGTLAETDIPRLPE